MNGMGKTRIFVLLVSFSFLASAAHADLSGDANKALGKTGEAVKKGAKGAQKGLNKAGDSVEKGAKGPAKGTAKDKGK
ncbi:MAG: hypothetical protein HY098_04080 [Nitrospinae bacterium]|nr:hypothetical protein [Nitrospinota bacterium]